jgi:hypothetical protein
MITIEQNRPLDLVLIWTQIDTGTPTSRNSIVKLAIHILSVIANSAGTEHAFSDFSITHTKHRNKLNPEKCWNERVLSAQLGLSRTFLIVYATLLSMLHYICMLYVPCNAYTFASQAH